MKENIIQKKSYDFALRIINLEKKLKTDNKEFTLSRQILRSGTSIGANVEEAIGGFSKRDFICKLTILLDKKLASHLLFDCEEILRIISAIQHTSKINS